MARIERAADDVLHPLRAFTLRSALRLPEPTSGPALIGEGLALSAVKPSEEHPGWIVLRSVNLLDEPVAARWTLDASCREVYQARLDEGPGARLEIRDGAVRFTAAPRAVTTILVRR